MRPFRELRSRLQYKIILPFLLLTLLVALAGAAVALTLVTDSLQNRFDNQLAQVARGASDSVVRQEEANLQFLRAVVFAPANPDSGAPAVADALGSADPDALQQALDPYFRDGVSRDDLGIDRMIVFGPNGDALIDWEQPRDQGSDAQRIVHSGTTLQGQWFTEKVLSGIADATGDKYAGLLSFQSGPSYLFTVAPVRQGEQVVGGALVARRLDGLIRELRVRAQADIVAVYDPGGRPLVSTFEPNNGLQAISLAPELADRLVATQSQGDVPPEQQLKAVYTVPVNARDYQFAYSSLKIRNAVVGLVAVALARDYIIDPWTTTFWPIALLTVSLMLAIIVLGVWIARTITRPLEELVATADAVTGGNFGRRSDVQGHDEVGQLAASFNTMTDYLVQLYGEVQAEASRSQAIVQSMADGVIVCDSEGQILVANVAAHDLVAQAGRSAFPERLDDLPLQPLAEDDHLFGAEQAAELRIVGERVVRLNVAPVVVNGIRLGDVYLLQDLTAEAAVDRARTSFIATISHEMRTPLTVLRGYADLMLRGLVGKLSDEQSDMLESMRQQINGMTLLINNVIVMANIDAGSLQTHLEPIAIATALDEALWQQRGPINAKGIEIVVELPDDLPPVLADRDQLRQILVHLLDNARRYTNEGTIAIRAHADHTLVQIDVRDTGCGIAPELRARIFDKFIRGDDGINSPERGIGLGLAIVEQLVKRHGGSVWCESERGRGSTFSFTLRQGDGPSDHGTSNNTEDLAAAA
jgi:signal transduction histidine kinase/HAMP domain-containing protein